MSRDERAAILDGPVYCGRCGNQLVVKEVYMHIIAEPCEHCLTEAIMVKDQWWQNKITKAA
jgi:hypothetical protein